ncbi:hypothetical protein SLS60_000796 [Paraconiothyrium brasiliense]|uniref:Uncharacterized protein n=1 Tax=Paraconiothyrium brasiliense TaxID=300254 RepID=A0ABR3S822_9PLEO
MFRTLDPLAPITSFADRHYALAQRVAANPSGTSCTLIPFDVKSSTSHKPQKQKYRTTLEQRRLTAFFICLCAADPGFVEVIPNALARKQLVSGGRWVAVSRSCEALLDPQACHFLSACNSLYHMPLDLLPAALANIRAYALNASLRYTNPWTQACFRSWTPSLLHSIEQLIPSEDAQPGQFTAYEGTVRIQRAIRNAHLHKIPIRFDFILHQPHLADFKLITPGREVLVQYKIDKSKRAQGNLKGVGITRGDVVRGAHSKRAAQAQYYFTAFKRYILGKSKSKIDSFFFLPKKILPDRFYTTTQLINSFEDEAFRPYWLCMDPAAKWVKKVYRIIQDTAEPRRPSDRPLRELASLSIKETPDVQGGRAPAPTELGWFYQQFFDAIMHRCARRMSGLLIVLARDHQLGDFAYYRYR